MMKADRNYCSKWKNILATVHPDELSPDKRKIFEEHLSSCSHCIEMQAEDQKMAQLLRSALSPKTPLPSWKEQSQRRRNSLYPSLKATGHIQYNQTSSSTTRPKRLGRALQSIDSIIFLGGPFDIEEVSTSQVVRETPDHFIEVWPLFSDTINISRKRL